MPASLLQLRNLSVRYFPRNGAPTLALDAANLSIVRGEIVGILGESGSGKTTLGQAVVTLLPTAAKYDGQVFFDGRDLMVATERELSKIRGRHISLVPQDPASALNPVMRIGTQIAEVLRAHEALDRKGRIQRIHELLAEVGLDDPERIGSSYPHQLSGGQRQRVVIAMAIACRPQLIIADEPVSKLDLPLQLQVLELMSGIARKHCMALLWITHDPATLLGFADRIGVMQAGQIVEQGPTEQIFRHPQHPYTQALVGLTQEFALSERPLVNAHHAN
ncbi:MAG TPA: ABC transporter ATP-binding protein [Terriglobales bacterium]|nr:ABC transporter ATP-binding protein [Terriglobales bacterium]